MNDHDSKRSWYVLRTKARRELLVASLLEESGELTVFLPEVLQSKPEGKKLVPLFPTYLFVQADLASSAGSRIRHTPCVMGLVGSEQQPLPIADQVVEGLQERVATVNDQGGLAHHSFKPGDTVVFRAGPLQGLDAVFVGPMEPMQRVQVLLEFLGQEQQMEVDVGLLEKTNSAPQQASKHSRPRRTRGKGRRVRTQVEQV